MKNRILKSGISAFIIMGSVVVFTSCHSNDYTKSSASETTPASDTSAAKTDTASSSSSTQTMAKKKGKISVGAMNAKGSGAMKPDKDGVYEMTDVSPAYPGGQSALEDYVNNHVEYPQTAIDNNSEGTVQVQFVVDADGTVMNPKVVGKGLGNDLDGEAVKVVSGMPKWTPGKVKGKNVNAKVILPITYKMEE